MNQFAKKAQEKGFKVIIAGAGGAAHLPGMIASHTNIPVIGVPINSTSLDGLDSLLSIVQMPKGIPVASMSIGNSGAINAAIFAAEILSLEDKKIAKSLFNWKKLLSKNGTFILEIEYLNKFVKNLQFERFYFDRPFYYSIKSIHKLTQNFDMHIEKIEFI